MGVIERSNVIDGGGLGDALANAGAPVAGTNEVQTVTLGGTGGTSTFNLRLDGVTTGAIAWSATNATLLSNINAVLDAAFGASQIVATDSTLTAGLGDLLLTFSGANYGKRAVSTMVATILSGALTAAVAETTPGVNATGRNSPAGSLLIDTTNKKLYVNTGSAQAPTWTVVGTQS